MKISALALACALFAAPSYQVYAADSNRDAIARCLADSTTGKDRKDLARWVFVNMAQHPEVASIATISSENRERADQTAGLLYQKLFTVSCKTELAKALKESDMDAVKSGFESLGVLAMQELMANPAVLQAFTNIQKYLDLESLKSVPDK
jgi:hypothetical protein